MSDLEELSSRIDVIERGYEYLLAYAAQGRQAETGTEAREWLTQMHVALLDLPSLARRVIDVRTAQSGIGDFLAAVEQDARIARGAIGLVLSRQAVSSLLVDNLNASVHLRALLTDVFLIEQALKGS